MSFLTAGARTKYYCSLSFLFSISNCKQREKMLERVQLRAKKSSKQLSSIDLLVPLIS